MNTLPPLLKFFEKFQKEGKKEIVTFVEGMFNSHGVGRPSKQKQARSTSRTLRTSGRAKRFKTKTPHTVTLQVKIERGQRSIKNQHKVPDRVLVYPCAEISQHTKKKTFHLQCYLGPLIRKRGSNSDICDSELQSEPLLCTSNLLSRPCHGNRSVITSLSLAGIQRGMS